MKVKGVMTVNKKQYRVYGALTALWGSLLFLSGYEYFHDLNKGELISPLLSLISLVLGVAIFLTLLDAYSSLKIIHKIDSYHSDYLNLSQAILSGREKRLKAEVMERHKIWNFITSVIIMFTPVPLILIATVTLAYNLITNSYPELISIAIRTCTLALILTSYRQIFGKYLKYTLTLQKKIQLYKMENN